MRRWWVWLLVVVLAAVIVVGLLGVFLPPTVTEAAGRVDPACMKVLKRDGVPYERRVRKCRVRVRTIAQVGTAQVGDDGWWKWRTGNFAWEFFVEVSYHAAVVGSQMVWVVDGVDCYVGHVYIVTLNISRCRAYRSGPGTNAGANYEVSFGPVLEGHRTYIRLPDGGAVEGPVWQ